MDKSRYMNGMFILAVMSLFGGCLAGTTPDPFADCLSTGHRHHPTNRHMFQVMSHGILYDKYCPNPLIWDQEQCACNAQQCIDDDPNCPGFRAVKDNDRRFKICVWGVWQPGYKQCDIDEIWNQTNCWCEWRYGEGVAVNVTTQAPVEDAPCKAIFNATFDVNVIDDGEFGHHIGRVPWQAISIDNKVEGAVGSGAVRVKKGELPLWWTSRNDLGETFQIEFRFKVIDKGERNNRAVSLLSNYCALDQTTISLSYRASDQRYFVFIRTADQFGSTLNCTVTAIGQVRPFEFHKVSLEYQDDILAVKVDEERCLTSKDFKGPLVVTWCTMILGGRPTGFRQSFDGYFDEVMVRRECIVFSQLHTNRVVSVASQDHGSNGTD